MIWIVLLVVIPLWIGWRRRNRATPVSRNAHVTTRKTGPVWEQPTPWVLDLEDEEDV